MKRRAFTLVEILITLVIIGALGGMMYLAFGGADDSAKAKACEGNRVAIKTAYDMYKFSAGASAVSLDEFVTHISNYKDFMTNEPKCPYGEAYHYSVDPNNGKLVVCNHPTTTGPIVAAKPFGDSSSIAKIIDISHNVINKETGNIDSSAPIDGSTWLSQVLPALKDEGIDLVATDATMWKFMRAKNNPDTLIWTTVDVSDLKVGDAVPVMRYNANLETYSVWTSSIVEVSEHDTTYKALSSNITEIKASSSIKANDPKKKSYEEMRAVYDEHLKTLN